MARIPMQNVDLDKIYEKRDFALGTECEDELGRVFRFIKYDKGDASTGLSAVAGYLVVGRVSTYTQYQGTCDYSESNMLNVPLGFAQAALTDGTYGWVQIHGYSRKDMLTDGGVASSHVLFAHATTDGAVDSGAGPANATTTAVGVALAADSTTAQTAGTAFITVP